MKPTHYLYFRILPMVFVFCAYNVLAERTTSYQYNEFGQVTLIDGPRVDVNDITTFDYDPDTGNLIKATNALGHKTLITTHDAHGRPLTIVDANNVVTKLTYNFRGRLNSRDVDGHTTHFDYDNVGNIERLTLPTGAYIDYDYDAAQRLIAIEDNLGNRIDYTLDAAGNRTEEDVQDPNGNLTRTQSQLFNELNRLTETVGGANQSTLIDYDPNGNLTSITDGLGHTTLQAFDALNRLKEVTDPANGLTEYEYDARDNLIRVTDPKGLTTTYTYDGLDNLIAQTSPDTGLTTFTHDEASNVLSQINANDITVNFYYDALNRLTLIDYADDRLDISFIYDEPGASHGIGRLTTMIDASGTYRYHYDSHGNVVQVRSTMDGIDTLIKYTYNSADQMTQMTYPSGRTVDFQRNSIGQIETVTTAYNNVTQTLAGNITYAPFGPLTDLTYGNGLKLKRQFDLDYHLTEQQTSNIHDMSYLYNANDNITDLINALAPDKDQAFDYDKLNRLTVANGDYGAVVFGYDAVGNRLTRSQDGLVDTYNYANDSHRLLNTSTNTYSYDNVGNTISNGVCTFIYGEHNRLAEVRNSDKTLVGTYTYNGLGQRTKKVLMARPPITIMT